MIEAPLSWGDMIDRITILEIKLERITDEQKLANVGRELVMLSSRRRTAMGGDEPSEVAALAVQLRRVNEGLWDVEDDIRERERIGDFGPDFVALARAVYITNDERARLKRAVNLAMGSEIVEEKSYAAY